MIWISLYLGGVLCLIMAMTAAFNNGLGDTQLTFNVIVMIALFWPLIFTYLSFKKF